MQIDKLKLPWYQQFAVWLQFLKRIQRGILGSYKPVFVDAENMNKLF